MIIIANSLTCLKVSVFLVLLTIHVGAFSSSINNGSVKCRRRERVALLKFKAELTNDNGQLSSWRNEGDDGKDCCKWEGVLCDNRTNHVVELDLHGMELEGKISPSLLELTNLNHLDLSYNYFPEAIPEFVGSLGKLHNLNLSSSCFGGLIPHSLGNLSNLRFLDLSGNSVLVENLDWLSGLQSLEYLDLTFADLQSATTWPQAINKLEEIHLQSCGLSTNMLNSRAFYNASTSLVVLDLSRNHIEGRIPHTIGSLISLSYLDLSFNRLRGEFPDSMENLTCLSHLDLSYNLLQGELPDSIGNLRRLSHLDLSYNQLQGEFLDTVGNLSQLSYLVLSNNKLQGEFPRSSNQLNESLVQGNLRHPNLQVLDVSKNKFSGQVPNLSSCLSLRWLGLHNNMFNGTLTESIGYLSNVEHLDLSSNHLEGQVSEAHLLNLSKLRVLDLSFNSNLTIRISSFWNPPFQLSTSMLAHCGLGPHFPKWLQNQKQLEVVDSLMRKSLIASHIGFGTTFK